MELGSFVRSHGAEYVAFDTNPDFLKVQQEAGSRTIAGDIRNIHIPADTFDVAHARFVIAHLGKDKSRAIEEVLKVVKPGGRALFIDYDWAVAEGSAAFNRLRDLFIQEMLFDADFGAELEETVRSVATDKDSEISARRYPVPRMTDYDQVLTLREAANKDLQLQGKDRESIDACNAIFDELATESVSRNPPGFRFPDLVVVIVKK